MLDYSPECQEIKSFLTLRNKTERRRMIRAGALLPAISWSLWKNRHIAWKNSDLREHFRTDFLKGSLTEGVYEEYADRLEVIEEGLAQAKQALSEKPLREGKQNKNLPDLVRKVC